MKRTVFLADRFVAQFSKSAVQACLRRMTKQGKKSFTARYTKRDLWYEPGARIARRFASFAANDIGAARKLYNLRDTRRMKVSAWWMWRSVYLAKLPRLAKKLRVAVDWTLDLFFGRKIEQTITARDIEATAEQIARVRARRSITSRSLKPEASVPNPTDTYAVR